MPSIRVKIIVQKSKIKSRNLIFITISKCNKIYLVKRQFSSDESIFNLVILLLEKYCKHVQKETYW